MNPQELRRLVFEIEHVAVQDRISNFQIDAGVDVEGIVIDMTKRIAVRREMFENHNKPPMVSSTTETVKLKAKWPSTWWDAAKIQLGFLRFLVRCGLLGEASWEHSHKSERIETKRIEKHYIQQVTVLNDEREIPAHMKRIEVEYSG